MSSIEPTNHPEFSGGLMPDTYNPSDHDGIAHRDGPVDPNDYEFWCGCYYNTKGNLYTATKRLVFSWTDGSDEPAFAWICELKDGRFAAVEGGHDYTGWDCQSSLEVVHVAAGIDEAAKYFTDDPRRAYAASAPEQP